jgi:hypothetical protein
MSRASNPSSILGSLLVAAAVLLVMAGPVSANHEPARLGLTPVGQDGSYFELNLKPGQVRKLQVEAANFGHEETLARTYAADVYSIVNGGFGASLFGERPSGTTLWITYPAQEFTLGPGDAIAIDFKVELPPDTPPGEYVAALVIENAEPLRGSGTIAVDQVNRSAIAVAIKVSGEETPALAIGDVRQQEVTGLSVVSFEVHNSGNVHLRPAGDFVLRDGGGTEIAASSVTMDTVYAGTSTLLEAPALELLGPGEYCAELTLTDQETGATDATDCLPFTVVAPADGDGLPFGGLPGVSQVVDAIGGSVPLLPVLILLLLAGLGALLLVFGRRRRRTTVVDGPAPGWPTTDRTDSGRAPQEVLPEIIGAFRRVLDSHPGIRRAWIIERGSGLVLAFEGAPGTTPADASRLARTLQERADREVGLVMPMQVVYLQGPGPVARMTAGAVPFYVKLRET